MVRSCEENYGYDAEKQLLLGKLRSSSQQLPTCSAILI
jgi:hypothetical protein